MVNIRSSIDPMFRRQSASEDFRNCLVVSTNPLQIQQGDGDIIRAISAIPNVGLLPGDRVLVQRVGADVMVTQLLSDRPATGYVTKVDTARWTAHVDVGPKIYDMQYLRVGFGSADSGGDPQVGQKVRILWDGSGGLIVGPAPEVTGTRIFTERPKEAPVTMSLEPLSWCTYRAGRVAANYTDVVMQGIPAGGGSQPGTGCWFYGDVFGGLETKKCTSASIDIARAAGVGPSKTVTVELRLHDHAQPSAGTPTVSTEKVTVPIGPGGISHYTKLPNQWGDWLATGKWAGIGVYTDGGLNACAALFGANQNGSGTLHLTFTPEDSRLAKGA